VFEDINHYVAITPRKWPSIVNKFTEIMEIVDTGTESYITGRMKEWLSDYLESKRPYDKNQTVGSKEPFVHKKYWYVYDEKFWKWCYHKKGHLDGRDKMRLDLTLVGAKEKQLSPKHPSIKGKYTTRRAFKIPHDMCKPPDKTAQPSASLKSHMGSGDPAGRTVH
jgi:hypothetical protein